jgi:eukaryotic-like serine/threonine-protein kinase
MVCGHCGGQVPASAGACPRCRTPIGSATATGVLTPPGGFELPGEADAPTFVGGFAPGPDRTPDFADDAPTLSGGSALDPATTLEAPTIGALPTMLSGPPSDDDLPTLGHGSDRPAPSVPGDTGPLAPGHQFGPRYHIIRLLGIGGMGAVYQAWDAELGVAVAIKVIRREVMSDPAAATEVERRFKRELLLARQVTHKNVVRIHDLGEIDGIKYITMPYVDGADLSSIMKKEGRLTIPKTLRIARSVASGLVAAHKAGVVHRDLKPANIMVGADGEAMIMDFGIARSAGGPADSGRRDQSGRPIRPPQMADATMVGTIVGTVEYMAPEQAKGQAVDQRADLYAFGLILYDVLAGRRRVDKPEGAIAELQARMEKAPPPIKTLAPEVPDALATVVGRCLEPDPAARYQTTEELAGVLDRLDENGVPIPIRRVVGMRIMAAVVVLAAALLAGNWWYARTLIPPAAHDPVSVLIADFQNATGDPAFDRTLEPMLKRALEGASFITAFDRSAISGTLGVRAPEKLDEQTGREIAVKQGVNVVLSGSVNRQGAGYGVSVKAVQSVSGDVITTADGRASSKEQILGVATSLVTAVRRALGDDKSDSAQLYAMQTLSTTSLEVLRLFAAATEQSTNNKFEEAIQTLSKAVELDPKFGAGYLVLAANSRNLGRLQDSEKYLKEALRNLDGMTERERYNARGMLYIGTGDYQQCMKEYGDLVARFAADVFARNRLALCSTHLRDMRRAVDEMREVVKIVPKRAVFRVNLALYESYGGDFQAGEREARTAIEGSPLGLLPLAFAQLGLDQLSQASETYQALGRADGLGQLGASFAASGLGDLAIYEGSFSDGVRILEQGAAEDLKAKASDRAAAKFASIAFAHLSRRQNGLAAAAADKALANSQAVKIRFLAARAFVEANQLAKARSLISGLASETQAEPRAHAKILEGITFLKAGDPRQAIKVLSEANGLLDTWIGHFDLGRAYLEAGMFVQADSEFDRCIKRRGEALALFIDEEPTYGYLPAVYYYQGRTREGMQTDGFADSYGAYLNIRGKSSDDPLLPEVHRRAKR